MKIKPCPFCGYVPKADKRITFESQYGTKYGFIVCGECNCHGPDVRTGYVEHDHLKFGWGEDAIEAWNERKGEGDE